MFVTHVYSCGFEVVGQLDADGGQERHSDWFGNKAVKLETLLHSGDWKSLWLTGGQEGRLSHSDSRTALFLDVFSVLVFLAFSGLTSEMSRRKNNPQSSSRGDSVRHINAFNPDKFNYMPILWSCLLPWLLVCFTEYEIVAPYEVDRHGHYVSHTVAHHHRRKRSLESGGIDLTAAAHFQLRGLGQDFHMDLRPAVSLVTPGFTIQTLGEKGTEKLETFPGEDFCFYQGSLRSKVNSTVALSTCTGLVSWLVTPVGEISLFESITATGVSARDKDLASIGKPLCCKRNKSLSDVCSWKVINRIVWWHRFMNMLCYSSFLMHPPQQFAKSPISTLASHNSHVFIWRDMHKVTKRRMEWQKCAIEFLMTFSSNSL